MRRCVSNDLSSHVGGYDNDDIAEIHFPTMGVCQSTIIKELEKNVPDFGMSLFKFIHRHHLLIGKTSDCFGQDTALVIPNITWWGVQSTAGPYAFHYTRTCQSESWHWDHQR
mmetsp:Transcript_37632/g.91340  ORF Transcript_37632/g.91340 Transcript_37632/m.91340 type:complete len:112 (-) Transcript_37632:1229-1564(-)